MDEVTTSLKRFRLGEEKPIRLTARHERGVDMSLSSATISVWDANDTLLISEAAITPSGTTRLSLAYQITTGPTGYLSTAGRYRAIITHNFGGQTRRVQVPIEVLGAPS